MQLFIGKQFCLFLLRVTLNQLKVFSYRLRQH